MITAVEAARLSAHAGQLLQKGRFAEAIAAYGDLVSQAPDLPDAWYNLGYLQRATRRFEDALVSYAEAIARGMNQPEDAHVNRAAILSDHLLRTDEAERELLAALAIAPGFLTAWHNLGQLREDRDDRAGARDAYRAALALAPNDGRANARLAALDVFEGRAAATVERLREPIAAVRGGVDAAELHFALGNALDAAAAYPAAFEAFTHANRFAAAASPLRYNRATHDRLIDDLIAAFPAPQAVGSEELEKPAPVFICGMFRSGSTLCEQVLARHSLVTSGGELETIPAIVGGPLSPYPITIPSLTPGYIRGLRAAYKQEVQRLFPDASFLTDKLPENFLHIGVIKTLFPRATIVHTVRNAIDNILSVYFLYFADSVAYSSHLDDIVHYYAGYRRLMAHWFRLYPVIVSFDYDEFVASPEQKARELFAACGLQWEAQCDPRQPVTADIRTASTWQVRQPVHARSSGRWRNYAPYIDDIVAALSTI